MGKHRRSVPQMPWKAVNRDHLVRKYGKKAYESGQIVTIAWTEALIREWDRAFLDQYYGQPNDSLVRVTPLK